MEKSQIEKQKQRKLVCELFLAMIRAEEKTYKQFKNLIEPILKKIIFSETVDDFELIQIKEFYSEKAKISGFLEENRPDVFEYFDSLGG